MAREYGLTPADLDDMTFDEIAAFDKDLEDRAKAAKRADAKKRAKGGR